MKLTLEYRVTPRGKWKKTSVSVKSIDAIAKDAQTYLGMFSQNEQVGSDKISLRLIDSAGWETWKHESDQEVNAPKKLKEEVSIARLIVEEQNMTLDVLEKKFQEFERLLRIDAKEGGDYKHSEKLQTYLDKAEEQLHFAKRLNRPGSLMKAYKALQGADEYVKKNKKYFDWLETLTEETKGGFTNWQFPRPENIKQEYNVEYKHHIRHSYGEIFPTFKDFEKAVKEADIVEFDSKKDMKVSNRSRTTSKKSLIGLIKGYASYPEFRNEKTIENLYTRVANNESLDMPLILRDSSGGLHIMAGNTRADVALQTGNTYKAVVIDIPEID